MAEQQRQTRADGAPSAQKSPFHTISLILVVFALVCLAWSLVQLSILANAVAAANIEDPQLVLIVQLVSAGVPLLLGIVVLWITMHNFMAAVGPQGEQRSANGSSADISLTEGHAFPDGLPELDLR